ncbi:iron transporter [Halomarina halobia]|uniref:Iron transporter n=1 Tax=Halomarina halobia TaxID=3033386 RepID=A0ABD6A6F3_9EURY|nr:iron transporter [Halomarina sp. PSR21]
MRRREVLRALSGGIAVALAGCLDGFGTQSAWRDPPLVEDRPKAVYVPAVTEAMGVYGRETTGPYGLALLYSYPHRFWNVTNREREKVVVTDDDAVHLMVALWDRETRQVVPAGSDVSLRIERDGDVVTQEVAYPMLSQQMGFHYGANYPLDGEGDYEATVTVGRPTVRATGAFAGRFEDARSATFAFTFDTDDVYGLELRRLGERSGERGAVPTMDMDVPMGIVPPVDSLPGTPVGRTRTGDAVLEVLAVDDPARFDADGGAYLAVVARTPYNRIVIPMMALSATLARGGETIYEGALTETLDPELGAHYGAGVESLEPGDELRVSVDVPPQVARHDGYETAFFEMPDRTITVER